MTRRGKCIWAGAGLIALALFVSCTGIFIPGLDILVYLLVGWFAFIYRVAPKVQVRWDLLWSTIVCAAVFVAGAHLFLRWLHREMSAQSDPMKIRWRLQWTLSAFAVVILMFTSGMAVIGIVHQTAWLATSPKPLYHRRYYRADRIKCASNLRQIGYALVQYSDEQGGKLPDDFATLLLHSDLTPKVFICPSAKDTAAAGDSPLKIAENLRQPGHCSYVYLGKGLTLPLDPGRVLAYEPLNNHDDEGINILHGDMSVEWLDGQEAEARLAGLMANIEPTTQPVMKLRPPTTTRWRVPVPRPTRRSTEDNGVPQLTGQSKLRRFPARVLPRVPRRPLASIGPRHARLIAVPKPFGPRPAVCRFVPGFHVPRCHSWLRPFDVEVEQQ
ncbi:MAG TPA: hypothetical protein VFC78_13575 [Tepidisphaeraceae bacterium]|nr:hypothetical protein [Tepidisphaeraceae bacterium]